MDQNRRVDFVILKRSDGGASGGADPGKGGRDGKKDGKASSGRP